ncbi:MAG: restriction endonuclease subunit S [Lachnospiraceae bacterium]|nr:restriction endonuclease subunit S [Lachnospiraceae bacterium]
MAEEKNVPELRFPGFTDPWEQRKFEDLYNYASEGGTPDTKNSSFYENGDVPFVKIEDTENKYIDSTKSYITQEGLSHSSAWLIPESSVIFTNGATVGNVAINRLPVATKQGILGIIPSKNVVTEFLFYLLSSATFQREVRSRMATGTFATIILKNLNQIPVCIPSDKSEQEEIAGYLSAFDNLITLHQRKLDDTKALKKSLLQKMFPKEGEDAPELRFPGFTDPWEQRKLGDITTSYSGGTPTAGKSEYYGGDIPFIRSGEISSDHTELFLTEEGLNNSSATMVKVGDILYALYGATSGEVSISRLNGAINQAILAIIPNQGYDANFIMQWLQNNKSSIISTYLQGGQGNLSATIVKQLQIDLPSYEEQEQIGQFFYSLNKTITLHQRKLDDLKALKKCLLQKMFI